MPESNTCPRLWMDSSRAAQIGVKRQLAYGRLLVSVTSLLVLELAELTVRPQNTRPQAARALTMHFFE